MFKLLTQILTSLRSHWRLFEQLLWKTERVLQRRGVQLSRITSPTGKGEILVDLHSGNLAEGVKRYRNGIPWSLLLRRKSVCVYLEEIAGTKAQSGECLYIEKFTGKSCLCRACALWLTLSFNPWGRSCGSSSSCCGIKSTIVYTALEPKTINQKLISPRWYVHLVQVKWWQLWP